MLPFVHHRVARTLPLLERCSEVLRKYHRADLDLGAALHALLDAAAADYREQQRSAGENRLLVLKAECVSADEGTHPLTLERVGDHRRALKRAAALRALEQCGALLREDLARDRQQLDDAAAQLRPLVLLALQKRLLPLKLRKPVGQRRAQALWRALLAEPDAALAARQLALQLSVADIELLLIDALSALP